MEDKQESGSVFVLTVLVSLLLLGVGMGVLWVSSSGSKVSSNLTRRQEAMYAAEAGIERGRAVLTGHTQWDQLLGTTSGVPCTSTPYDPKRGNVLCDGATPLENIRVVEPGSNSESRLPSLTNITYTVYIRNNNTEAGDAGAGGGTFADGDNQIMIVAIGTGRDGLSHVGIEVVLARAGI